jgi:predicted RND superfamily exporter protein
VARSNVLIGPALLTAFGLSCGLAALAFSNLPLLRLFGWLSAFAMLAALVADLFVLRPTITFLMRFSRGWPTFGGDQLSPPVGDVHARN